MARQFQPMSQRKHRRSSSRPGARSAVAEVPSAEPSTLEDLRRLLASTGYIKLVIDPASGSEVDPATPLSTLVRLFGAQEAVEIEQAASALSPLSIDQLAKAGFLRRQGKRVISRIYIQAYRDLLFALPIDKSENEKTVMFVSPSSMELDRVMVRRRSRKTLDLGTGCGVLAMAAAQHSERVYAVDINPRALRFAEFNCRWNHIQNVTCLHGNCLEPVCNERFDLIITNPPFVISPASRLMYRDSGRDGDAFCIQLARDAAGFLNEGGYFEMIFQWIETAGADWQGRLLQSFAGMGCDVWILRAQSESPETHVRAWIKESDAESLHTRWMQYLARRGAASIGTGFCIMRRVAGRAPLVWFDELPEECSEHYGDAVASIFSIREHIENCSDPALLQQRLLASPHLRLVQESRCSGNGWQPSASELLLDRGMKYAFGDVDGVLASLASACDGKHTLQEVFESAALQSHMPIKKLISKYLPQVRELARYAFLMPSQ
jgi:SAM-dependent methyltransferase